MGLTGSSRTRLESLRAAAAEELQTVGPASYKRRGLDALGSEERRTVQKAIQSFADRGVFIVPVGELEGWLKKLGVTRAKKRDWIVDVFAKLGSDPAASSYVRPGTDDVWAFLAGMRRWFDDPARRGIP